MNKFQQTTPAPVTTSPTPTKDDRQYLHTMQAGAVLPLAQAISTGLIFGLSAWIISMLMNILDAWRIGLSIGVITLVGSWILHQRRWFDLTRIERTLNLDLNRDGVIGARPAPEVVRIQLNEVKPNGSLRINLIDLPASDDQLRTLAQGLLNSLPMSEKQWSGGGKIFSINEFRTLRTEMIKRGILELANEKDARQGYRLTAAGRAIMKRFASVPSPTPLEEQE